MSEVLILAGGMAAAATFMLSLALCQAVRVGALQLKLVDVPNARSLHSVPVPRLGGVAIVVSVCVALGAMAPFVPVFARSDAVVWLVASVIIAVLGFVDDIRHLPAFVRLLVQVTVAAVAMAVVLRQGEITIAWGLRWHWSSEAAIAVAVVFAVGTTNIFNFMDGMDGLAATQAVTVSLVLGASAASAGQVDITIVALVIAAASSGFFFHNAPPATLFLGDAGSTFLGFSFSVLAFVATTRPSGVPVVVVPIALAPFLLDGTFTIIRRLRRGERIWTAHRSHLYQRAVASGLSHRDVLLVYAAWSATAAGCALLAAQGARPAICAGLTMLAILAAVWLWVRRREHRSSGPSH
jgi:UDP-N-acetylmuramyl pentapeptide phosphotransferase/UDP-N-acetylglucosamine-1-phosphate transferase